MSSLTSLPDELIKLVMHHVPLHHRLSSCCLVSRKLQAAAVAATDDLQLQLDGQPRYIPRSDSVLGWLSEYGQQLTRVSLQLGYSSQPLLTACPNLLELKLSKCDVQLGEADGFQGVVQVCTNLTRLELECNLRATPEGAVIDGLSSLVHLQHLEVVPGAFSAHFANTQRYDRYIVAGLSGATLPRLQHLTFLKVNELSTENLLQLSTLTSLQELHLATGWFGDNSDVPALALPASLNTLVLFSQAHVEARLLSFLPPGLQDLRIDGEVDGSDEGPGSFLSFVAGLQHLTRLSLQYGNIVDWPFAGPAYSALTVSSKLVVLEMYDAYFPENIWQHVFAPMQKLPHLTSLVLWGSNDCEPEAPPPWYASDLCSIVRCCPNLCVIETNRLQPGLHVSELHKLTALTRLQLGYGRQGFDECVRGLAAVAQLKYIEVTTRSPDITVTSLLPLTSLTALTELKSRCYWHGQYLVSLCTSTQVNMQSHLPFASDAANTAYGQYA